MEVKEAFTAYLLQRQAQYKREQLKKQERLERELVGYEIKAKERMSKSHGVCRGRVSK